MLSRYWAVTNVDYIHSRTTGRVSTMIFLVWISAVIVSLAPQFGWKDPEYMERIEQQKCMVSQDIGYQVHFNGESITKLYRDMGNNAYSSESTFLFISFRYLQRAVRFMYPC